MSERKPQLEDVRRRGERLYRERVAPIVEPDQRGKFVVVDTQSGEYEIDEQDSTATRRLLSRRPGAVLYGVRVGRRAAYRLGPHVSRPTG